MARLVIDYDDTEESEAEVADWRDAEELLGAIERAWARLSRGLGLDQPLPDYLRKGKAPTDGKAAFEAQKAAFELGAMAFWDDILTGRRVRHGSRKGTAALAAKRSTKPDELSNRLTAAAAEYRKRHPTASARQMAKDLSRQLSKGLKKAIPPGTVRDRLSKPK